MECVRARKRESMKLKSFLTKFTPLNKANSVPCHAKYNEIDKNEDNPRSQGDFFKSVVFHSN